ncbi:unnamed protein product [Protopolystoma xenopodis]|uniref:Uncharacterized protein n=1 Tax=Protopolystoma xenopodis TaxID=117903 RepID=A0A448WZL0_9PLAT|nr:unnamed protein product [Protopolystoma xenopodis]
MAPVAVRWCVSWYQIEHRFTLSQNTWLHSARARSGDTYLTLKPGGFCVTQAYSGQIEQHACLLFSEVSLGLSSTLCLLVTAQSHNMRRISAQLDASQKVAHTFG